MSDEKKQPTAEVLDLMAALKASMKRGAQEKHGYDFPGAVPVGAPALTIENRTGQEVTYTVTPVGEKPANCPLTTGMRPCECDLPRCPECGYTMHDAQFEMGHSICSGTIPPSPPPAWTGADSLVEEVGPGPGDDALRGDQS